VFVFKNGFDDYAHSLSIYLHRYRQIEGKRLCCVLLLLTWDQYTWDQCSFSTLSSRFWTFWL